MMYQFNLIDLPTTVLKNDSIDRDNILVPAYS